MGNCLRLGIAKLGLAWSKWDLGNKNVKKSISILLLGLQQSGKTTIALRIWKYRNNIPDLTYVQTKGFSNYDITEGKKTTIHLYELGGHPSIRELWQHYYADSHGIIFVVDSSKPEDLTEAGQVLTEVLSDNRVRGKPVLMLANKQDVSALPEAIIEEQMNLQQLVNSVRCLTRLDVCSAIDLTMDDGIFEGFKWLTSFIDMHYARINDRVIEDTLKERSQIQSIRKSTKKKSEQTITIEPNDNTSLFRPPSSRQVRSASPVRPKKLTNKVAPVSVINNSKNDDASHENRLKHCTSAYSETVELNNFMYRGSSANSRSTRPTRSSKGSGDEQNGQGKGRRLSPEGADSDDILKEEQIIAPSKRPESSPYSESPSFKTRNPLPSAKSSDVEQPSEILMVTTAAQVHGGDNASIITETTSMESRVDSLSHSVFSLKGQ